jgi:glycosyltransferase involved in cell wall biosynthesis
MGINVGLWAPDGSATSSDVVDQSDDRIACLDGSLEAALSAFGPIDVMHDNGIWLSHNHGIAKLCAKRSIPRIVSVHGMLEPWAIQHRRFKKKLAWHLYQKKDLREALLLHSTAPSETVSLTQAGLTNEIVTIPNGTDIPADLELKDKHTRSGEKRKALFLSRIHPKKGLPMLLEAWAALRPQEWALEIAGPDEGGHKAEVVALIEALGLTDQVSFLGALNEAETSNAYRAADLFVLPTHSENFGMVVTEALAHGLPVLTTKGAPWSELESERCGWWVPPTVEGIHMGLQQAFNATDQERLDMGLRGRELVLRAYAWAPVAQQFLEAYIRVASTPPSGRAKGDVK